MQPTIAVVIPYYNRPQFIGEAIDSIRSQTRAASEIIVVDDGSRPEGAAALDRLPKNVTVIRQQNRGPAAARNVGVTAASSEWIAFLDDDDSWKPERLQVLGDYIGAHPECRVIHNAIVDSNGVLYRKATLDLSHFLFALVGGALPSSTMIRRDELMAAGLMNPAIRIVEDYDCFIRVSMHCLFHYVDEPLTIRRSHEGSISRNLLGQCVNQNRVVASYRHLYPSEEDYRRHILNLNSNFLVTAIYQRNWATARAALRSARGQGVARTVLALAGLKRLLGAKLARK